jgi:ankyrin repeat protein
VWVARLLDFKSSNHHTPITLAAARGDINMLTMLLDSGASPNKPVMHSTLL